MNISPGTLLHSTPSIDDANFDEVIIFITEYNAKGAMGFVTNKIFARTLNELVEFKNSPAFPLYEGGPVEQEHLYFIHQRPDLIEGGTQIFNSIYLGGNFKQAVTHINNKTITKDDIKIFIGYCGWDDNQLEEEIKENSWVINGIADQSIFS